MIAGAQPRADPLQAARSTGPARRAGDAAAVLQATETGSVRMQGVSGCRQHIESDYRRPERTGYWYVTLCLLPDGA